MIRTSPFHKRTNALNETGLWSHWSGHLSAHRYQLSDKFEYFAVRNAAGVFDSSPLYKYRIHGRDAERFLAGVLARDIRTLRARATPSTRPGATTAASSSRTASSCGPAADEFLLTAAEPNLAYFEDLIGRRDEVAIEEVSDEYGDPRRPGPAVARAARGARPGRGADPVLRPRPRGASPAPR